MNSKDNLGIYIHIPFCTQKCPYCDFYSMCGDEDAFENYTKALIREIENWGKKINLPADTIYFGGGTPSIMGARRIGKIISAIKENFCLLHDNEITVECNPSVIEDGFFEAISGYGVNRISMGMQSAVDRERSVLGRISSPETVIKRIENARSAGIENISLDLMLGVPGQNEKTLRESVDFCVGAKVEHISSYILKIEENTPFYKKIDTLCLPSEDEVCDQYEKCCEWLVDADYLQYEISNFARPGKQSRHNTKYWTLAPYLGLGPSAHSFIDNKRFFYPRDKKTFLNGTEPVFDCLSSEFDEYIMLSLRLMQDGIDLDYVRKNFGNDKREIIEKRSQQFIQNGLLKQKNEHITLTIKGALLSNAIIAGIL